MIPGDKDEAGSGPQLHKDDPVDRAEGGGVLILYAHTQRLHSLLQIRTTATRGRIKKREKKHSQWPLVLCKYRA